MPRHAPLFLAAWPHAAVVVFVVAIGAVCPTRPAPVPSRAALLAASAQADDVSAWRAMVYAQDGM